MGCLRVFFGCVEPSFPDGIIKPYEGTTLTIGKVCCVQYLLEFPLIWLHGCTCKTDPELETERLDIASFAVGSKKSLASQSGFSGWNLFGEMEIDADFWPGGDSIYVSFSTAGLNPGSWINRLCKSRKVLEMCDDEENLELYHVFNIAVENEW